VISDKILTPITNAITFLSKVAQKVMGLGGNDQQTPDQKNVTKEDLQAIAEIAAEQGMVPQKAGDMLQIVLELDEKPVSNAMTPLVDIVSIPENATAYEVEKLTQETGFSRFPVFKDRVDNIIGVIGLRQLVTAFNNDDIETFRSRPIKNMVDKSVLFVPESKPINHLIAELRRHYIPMAVVIDEYGGMIGLATIEDLAQQIVGSIQDFGEQDQLPCKPTDDEMTCDGRTPIREIEDAFDVEIDNEGFETIAGLVLKIAGTIPKINATFQYQDFRITVLDKQDHRITKVKIKRLPQP
jgi:putative hemolysin